MKRSQAEAIRALLINSISKDSITADKVILASQVGAILDWAQGVYIVGDQRLWNGNVVRCITAHDSTLLPDWTPANRSLFVPRHGTTYDTACPFDQPLIAEDCYQTGEYCIFEEQIWRSVIDNNAWSPTNYPGGWEVVTA